MTDAPQQPQDTRHTILVAGVGECAVAELLGLIGTGAHLRVFGKTPAPQITAWAEAGLLSHIPRPVAFADLAGADQLIAATGSEVADNAARSLAARATIGANAPGHVHFVGAGPGDPDLLTLRAQTLLREAEVILHDRLVPTAILALASPTARIVEVGKTAFGASWKQDDINARLVSHGAHARVVRLKSGDSGIFGRLDEEMNALDLAGIDYTITPGITASIAAAATLKVSLTKRGRNTGLRILTGHDTAGYADQDWRSLAEPGAAAEMTLKEAL